MINEYQEVKVRTYNYVTFRSSKL